jgi:hypothetical protein
MNTMSKKHETPTDANNVLAVVAFIEAETPKNCNPVWVQISS